MKRIIFALVALTLIFCMALPVFASEAVQTDAQAQTTEQTENAESGVKTSKAFASAIVVGIAAVAGAIAMAAAICKSNESIARQPEAEGSIKSNMMLGLVFIETAIIYALIVGILIIFVL